METFHTKARALCAGSIHGERGAIECRCKQISKALEAEYRRGVSEALEQERDLITGIL